MKEVLPEQGSIINILKHCSVYSHYHICTIETL